MITPYNIKYEYYNQFSYSIAINTVYYSGVIFTKKDKATFHFKIHNDPETCRQLFLDQFIDNSVFTKEFWEKATATKRFSVLVGLQSSTTKIFTTIEKLLRLADQDLKCRKTIVYWLGKNKPDISASTGEHTKFAIINSDSMWLNKVDLFSLHLLLIRLGARLAMKEKAGDIKRMKSFTEFIDFLTQNKTLVGGDGVGATEYCEMWPEILKKARNEQKVAFTSKRIWDGGIAALSRETFLKSKKES